MPFRCDYRNCLLLKVKSWCFFLSVVLFRFSDSRRLIPLAPAVPTCGDERPH